MASKHLGLKTIKLHGYSKVHVRGVHVGFIHNSGGYSYKAVTTRGRKTGPSFRTHRAAAEHLVRTAYRPEAKATAKIKRPKSVFRKRIHPTQSLGV